MMSQLTLLLICTLFSKAVSLTCQQCVSASTEPCEEISCQDQCLSMSTSVYTSSTGGTKLPDSNVKMCGVPEMCVSGSMNLGIIKITNNVKCCSTDLCNAETLPALPKQAPNGRMCYTCDAQGCSATVKCEGNEDRCITTSVKQGSYTFSTKGCVSKNLCIASASSTVPGIGTSNVQCCEGNLCNGAENNTGSSPGNGAESFTLSFLLMIIPLLSSILFY